MADPLFPIKPPSDAPTDLALMIEPYRHDGAWVFDDDRVGLVKEPFVVGITEMIDRLVADIRDAEKGFILRFASVPFDDYQECLTWLRADPVEGNWYESEQGEEGWLCPALFWYFPSPPATIYVKAESRPR
jgi:hypothetical protein